MNKPEYCIRSSAPLTAVTLKAAIAEVTRLLAESRAREDMAHQLAKRPAFLGWGPYQRVTDQMRKGAAEMMAKLETEWLHAVDKASDADLLAVAERYAPDEVDDEVRDRVRWALANAWIRGRELHTPPRAWFKLADRAVEELEALEELEGLD